MKPKTKKTLIWAAAIALIALIAWILFFRKKGWEREINNLNLTSDEKKQLRQAVKYVMMDPAYTKQQYEASASAFGLTFDQWVVILGAEALGWVAGTTNGQIDIRPTTGQSSVIPRT